MARAKTTKTTAKKTTAKKTIKPAATTSPPMELSVNDVINAVSNEKVDEVLEATIEIAEIVKSLIEDEKVKAQIDTGIGFVQMLKNAWAFITNGFKRRPQVAMMQKVDNLTNLEVNLSAVISDLQMLKSKK